MASQQEAKLEVSYQRAKEVHKQGTGKRPGKQEAKEGATVTDGWDGPNGIGCSSR